MPVQLGAVAAHAEIREHQSLQAKVIILVIQLWRHHSLDGKCQNSGGTCLSFFGFSKSCCLCIILSTKIGFAFRWLNFDSRKVSPSRYMVNLLTTAGNIAFDLTVRRRWISSWRAWLEEACNIAEDRSKALICRRSQCHHSDETEELARKRLQRKVLPWNWTLKNKTTTRCRYSTIANSARRHSKIHTLVTPRLPSRSSSARGLLILQIMSCSRRSLHSTDPRKGDLPIFHWLTINGWKADFDKVCRQI